jgi:hypothetical protein
MVRGLDLDADTVSRRARRGQARGARPREGIEHRIANEAEHPDEGFN